jgi:uncharacterized protein with FMN-binding domain
MAKMNKKMITLCSTAVGAVYMSGYFVTQSSASTLDQTTAQVPTQPNDNQSQIKIDSQSKGSNVASKNRDDQVKINIQQSNNSQHHVVIHKSHHSSQVKQHTSSIYKDGTYYGVGMNRIGSVQVAVTIKNDRITNVEIVNCHTHYSESYITHLPSQVIARQSANVDVVSGATKSTEDFQNAVEQALQKARN